MHRYAVHEFEGSAASFNANTLEDLRKLQWAEPSLAVERFRKVAFR